ncbi:MAG: hypothetical protein K2X69_03405 [Silvanigrellaceae bacterium]|nr:hypothetical protein [Silvanigrellaceae bacterium]
MKNKIYSIAFFLLLSTTSCAKKSASSSSQEEPNKPITEEQKPNLENLDEFDLEILNGKKPENFSNIEMKDLKFGENIFNSNCIIDNKGFKHCDFNKVNLNHYSTKKKNEFNFLIKYEFKDCNFDYLNVVISSSSNSHKIISGLNAINLTGDSLKINDTYVWDTKTNIYSPTCSFFIQDIHVSLSDFTIKYIDGFIKVMNEYKTILQLMISLKELQILLNQIISNNTSFQIKEIENTIKQSLNEFDNPSWKKQIKNILLEIEKFQVKNKTDNNKDYMEIKNKITEIIKDLLLESELNSINETINYNKQKALEILNEFHSFPNYNREQYDKYKNLLSY